MFEFMHHMTKESVPGKIHPLYANVFCPLKDKTEIASIEDFLGFKLPTELKAFYLEIGAGQLQTGISGSVSDFNWIASPSELTSILQGTSDWLMPYSQIEPDTLPFFQRGVDHFICLKPHSDNPNAVWWMWGDLSPDKGKICDSLVEFFERLIEDPNWFNPPKLKEKS